MSGRGGFRGGGGGGGGGRGGGRGWYYKQLYGGGGRGRGGGGGGGGNFQDQGEEYHDPAREVGGGNDAPMDDVEHGSSYVPNDRVNGNLENLRATLRRIDGAGYKAYNDILGGWSYPDGSTVWIDKIQSDPFAPPSRCHLRMPHSVAKFPKDLYNTKIRTIALSDFICRVFCRLVKRGGLDQAAGGAGWSGPKGGDLQMDVPGQQVLERTAVRVTPDFIEARFTVALPAAGRSVLGQRAAQILADGLPTVVRGALMYASLDAAALRKHVDTVDDQEALRGMLRERGLVAFVADGSVLPRQSGASDLPMAAPSGPGASPLVPFASPESLRVDFTLPHRGKVTGLGVRAGITLVVGGGFHGKSTLLQALQMGVYNHIPSDGRELVVTDPAAVTIRAEDGRSVASVDVRPFINNLPFGKGTADFSTPDASGSTSQAANIVEALEAGARLLLIDEDTAATNFMIRDRRMMQLVAPSKEPITPFISRVRQLHSELGVSSILVVGGCGDYFDVADCVIMQENYATTDVTAEARRLAMPRPADELAAAAPAAFARIGGRVPLPASVRAGREGDRRGYEKITINGKHIIRFGDGEIDLGCVHQIAHAGQTRAIGDCLVLARDAFMDGSNTVQAILDRIEARFDSEGLDALGPGRFLGNFARPRRFEIAAALNRLRTVQFRQSAR